MNNPNTNRNWLIAAIAVIIIIIIALAMRDNEPNVNDEYFNNASTTESTSGTDATSGSNTNSNGSAGSPTTGGVAGSSLINNDATLKSVINNSLIRLPESGTDVALVEGRATVGSSTTQSRVATGAILGKVQTDQGYDVFVELTLTKGTTDDAKIKHVALFQVLGDKVFFRSSAAIGTNVELSNVVAAIDPATASPTDSKTVMSALKSYNLTVTYLDRKNGEAQTAVPTVSKTMVLRVKNHVVTR